MSTPYTKQSVHLLGILLITCLLGACSTKNVGHLPRQAMSGQSAQIFQMQYVTLHVSNAQAQLSKESSGQASARAPEGAPEGASKEASERALSQKPKQAVQNSKHSPDSIQLNITAQIRTENLPTWVTRLDLATLTIYLVNAKDTVIATHKVTLLEQDLRKQTQVSLNVLIPLPENLDPNTLSLAFGYRLPISNAEKTRRIVLTEMAVNTK